MAAHQVDHLPWLGYFARMRRVDIFVELDEVQYNHHRFQNRNRIVDRSGRVLWVRVPIRGGKQHVQRMSEAEIADEPWRHDWLETVRHAYARHPHFAPVFGDLADVIGEPWRRLVDLNRALRSLLASWLGIATPLRRQSDLGFADEHGEDLLIAIARELRAQRYLSGPTGRAFLAGSAFERAGVPLEFDPPYAAAPYPQRGLADFVPDLSALDVVMNLGRDAGRVVGGRRGGA